MKPPHPLVTFDVYTALFDIEASLTLIVRAALPHIDALTFVRAWRRKQLELALISNSLGEDVDRRKGSSNRKTSSDLPRKIWGY